MKSTDQRPDCSSYRNRMVLPLVPHTQQYGQSWPQVFFLPLRICIPIRGNQGKGFPDCQVFVPAGDTCLPEEKALPASEHIQFLKHQDNNVSSIFTLACDTTVVPGTGELGMTRGCAGTGAAVCGGSGSRGCPWGWAGPWLCPPLTTAACWGAELPAATVVLNKFWAFVVATDTY